MSLDRCNVFFDTFLFSFISNMADSVEPTIIGTHYNAWLIKLPATHITTILQHDYNILLNHCTSNFHNIALIILIATSKYPNMYIRMERNNTYLGKQALMFYDVKTRCCVRIYLI